MKAGAVDFLTKPFDEADLLGGGARRGGEGPRLARGPRRARLDQRAPRHADAARARRPEPRRVGQAEQADRGRARHRRKNGQGAPRANDAEDAGSTRSPSWCAHGQSLSLLRRRLRRPDAVGLADRPGRGLGRAGAARRRRLLPRRAPRLRLHPPAAPDLDAVAAERAAPRRAAARADARLVVAARRGAARAPAGGAAERRADGDGARLVRQQLQRGADRRGRWCAPSCPGRCGSIRCAAPASSSAAARSPRRSLSSFLDAALVQPHRLGRARLLGPRAHALLLQRARRAHRRAADPDLGRGRASRGCARRRSRATPRPPRCSPGCSPTCMVVFDLPQFDAHTAPALFYAPLPFLLWAAVRFGPRGHRERDRGDGGGDDLGRRARPGAVRRRHAAGHGARNAAFPERGRGADAAARGGARGARAGSSSTRASSACSSRTSRAWRCWASSPAASPTSSTSRSPRSSATRRRRSTSSPTSPPIRRCWCEILQRHHRRRPARGRGDPAPARALQARRDPVPAARRERAGARGARHRARRPGHALGRGGAGARAPPCPGSTATGSSSSR